MPSPELIARCRELRKIATKAEKILWSRLRAKQLDGQKFRRQHPFQGFILDFFCPEAMLAIEIDGSIHQTPENWDLDKERTEILNQYGVEVLRFWNSEVEKDIEGVLEKIKITAVECIKSKSDEFSK